MHLPPVDIPNGNVAIPSSDSARANGLDSSQGSDLFERRKNVHFPPANFAFARPLSVGGAKVAQVVGHRGCPASFPENTMIGFDAAVKAGADGIETDLRLSLDGVVVISHDLNLKRIFGINKTVSSLPWSKLSELHTTKAPHLPMAQLTDVLEFLDTPERKDIWLNLDIKRDDDPAVLIKRIAETLAERPGKHKPWAERILFGCWTPPHVAHVARLLPNYAISHISISTLVAAPFMAVPNLGFSMNYMTLGGSQGVATIAGWVVNTLRFCISTPRRIIGGRSSIEIGANEDVAPHNFVNVPFLQLSKQLGRPVAVWTVDSEIHARWCFKHSIDTIITNDPEKLVRIRRDWVSSLGKSTGDQEGRDTTIEGGDDSAPTSTTATTVHTKPTSEAGTFSIRMMGKMVLIAFLLHIVSVMRRIVAWKRKGKNSWQEMWQLLEMMPDEFTGVEPGISPSSSSPSSMSIGDDGEEEERETKKERAKETRQGKYHFPIFGPRGGLRTLLAWWSGEVLGHTVIREPDVLVVELHARL